MHILIYIGKHAILAIMPPLRRIRVSVQAGARHASVQKTGPDEYRIAVTEPPRQGKANEAVRRMLAREIDIAPSRLSLLLGHSAKVKVFTVR